MKKMTVENVVRTIHEKPNLADVLTTEKLREFAEWAVKGETIPRCLALHYMIAGYTENCGISPIPRALYFEAGQQLFKRLTIEQDAPISEPFDNDAITFSTAKLDSEDFLIHCMEECGYNIPDAMKAALCYGVFLLLTSNK